MFVCSAPSLSENRWTCTDKVLVTSALVLTVSAVALLILFFATNPLTNTKNMAFLYADCCLGGVALLALVLSGLTKICQLRTSQDLNPHHESSSSSTTSGEISLEPLPFDEKEMQQAVVDNWDNIRSKTGGEKITIYEGKHMDVFEHADFPGLIIKLLARSNAQKLFEHLTWCEQVLEEHKDLESCWIPPTRLIPLEGNPKGKYDPPEGYALFVMKKVDGIIPPFASQEASELAFEQFQTDPQIEKKWRKYFRDAAEFICLTGYWDTSWRNILLMENGFGFVDFERIGPSMDNKLCGIARLMEMAPPTFYDMLVGIAIKHGIEERKICPHLYETDISEAKLKRQNTLNLRTKVRKWHHSQKITQAAQKIDTTHWTSDSLERKIIDQFHDGLEDRIPYYIGSLMEQRALYVQPFCGACLTNFEQKDDFHRALTNLQKAGVICDWTTTNLTDKYVGYQIYF